MIIFDQLRISDDGRKMYINVHVNQSEYFEDVYVESVTIMAADKVSETTPGVPTEDFIFTKTIEGNEKSLALVLTVNDFIPFAKSNLSDTLFFVYVKCKGTPSLDVPCRLDEMTTVAVTFDDNMLHQRVMCYTKELVRDCNIPTAFVDFILLWNAFKASVETEHYIEAIKFYDMLFEKVGEGNTIILKGCGCNG